MHETDVELNTLKYFFLYQIYRIKNETDVSPIFKKMQNSRQRKL